RAAGLVASRCNFAHVKMNGESLGIYTNVESIKDPFLAANYGDSSGNLYEGALADFREHYLETFERKNGGDGLDLAAVQVALEIEDDAAALAALAELIDLDLFMTHWALEGLIGNWDGYSGNSNNFWIYMNPNTDRFEFIPWSLDDIFGRDNPFSAGPGDARTVFETASLTNRLWQISGIPEQYEARINQLIDTIWDEDALLTEIDRMETLLTPIAGDLSGPIADTRSWISGRAADVASDFSGGPPNYASPLPGKRCLQLQGEIAAGFTSTYNDPIPAGGLPSGSSFSVTSFEFGGTSTPVGIGTAFGPSYEFGSNIITLRSIGVLDATQGLIFNIPMPAEDVVANTPEAIAVEDTLGSFLLLLNLTNFSFFPIGAVVNTELQLDQANLSEGGAVSGTFSSDLAAWIPHPAPEPGMGLSYVIGVLALAAMARRRSR
ncbi:MAG: CotH kinase family protein, partial [Myxococcota bacterium]